MSTAAGYRLGKLTRKRTDGSSYWSFCIIFHEGTRKRHSLDTTCRVTAEATARQFWATRRGGRIYATVGPCVDAYLDSLGGTKDEKRKREGWAAAKPFWADLPIALIDEQTSASYLTWRQRAANTMRNELSVVRTSLKWAERQIIDVSGAKMIERAPPVILPPMPESSVDHLTKPQFRQFLTGCGMPHVRLFAILGVTTGARKAALLQAKWDQVDWDRELLDLNAEGVARKGNKSRAVVALNDRAMEALREAKAASTCDYLIEYRGCGMLDIKKGIAAASTRSGIHAHPHMFRHSAAVWMAEDRVPMAEIASFLGHKNINITIRVYARYHPDYLRQAARSLTW